MVEGNLTQKTSFHQQYFPLPFYLHLIPPHELQQISINNISHFHLPKKNSLPSLNTRPKPTSKSHKFYCLFLKKIKFLVHLLTCMLLLTSFFHLSVTASGFCNTKCEGRCAKAGVQDQCLKYCGICCETCHCVPLGTYGNKHECPCYERMKNSKGKSKCP